MYECSRREHADVEALCSTIKQCVGPVDIESQQYDHDSESDILAKLGTHKYIIINKVMHA